MPQLSLIVPVYNVEAFVGECLDSILSQAADDVEVIVVEDASTDSSASIVHEYAASDLRVRVITRETNRGLGAARNTGLAAASGDYVLFIDSDDWLADGALPAIAERLTATSPDVLIYDFARARWRGQPIDRTRPKPFGAP